MNELVVMKLAKDAIVMVVLLSAPSLLLGLIVGLAVSIFQAVTSIQESTLAIIPKILAVFLALLVTGPWCLKMMVNYTYQIIASIPQLAK